MAMRPEWRHRWSRRWRNAERPDTVEDARTTCRVCGFAGIRLDQEPAERRGQAAVTVTGSVYAWTAANDPLTVITKATQVIPGRGQCPHCGAERYLDGRRGAAMRVP